MKKYPFNIWKHGHDLEFRRNRAKNELWEKEYNKTATEEEVKAYNDLIDRLGAILMHLPTSNGIIWLTGEDLGLAKETVNWAGSMREIR